MSSASTLVLTPLTWKPALLLSNLAEKERRKKGRERREGQEILILYMQSFSPQDNPWRQALLSCFRDEDPETQRG